MTLTQYQKGIIAWAKGLGGKFTHREAVDKFGYGMKSPLDKLINAGALAKKDGFYVVRNPPAKQDADDSQQDLFQ